MTTSVNRVEVKSPKINAQTSPEKTGSKVMGKAPIMLVAVKNTGLGYPLTGTKKRFSIKNTGIIYRIVRGWPS